MFQSDVKEGLILSPFLNIFELFHIGFNTYDLAKTSIKTEKKHRGISRAEFHPESGGFVLIRPRDDKEYF